MLDFVNDRPLVIIVFLVIHYSTHISRATSVLVLTLEPVIVSSYTKTNSGLSSLNFQTDNQ